MFEKTGRVKRGKSEFHTPLRFAPLRRDEADREHHRITWFCQVLTGRVKRAALQSGLIPPLRREELAPSWIQTQHVILPLVLRLAKMRVKRAVSMFRLPACGRLPMPACAHRVKTAQGKNKCRFA